MHRLSVSMPSTLSLAALCLMIGCTRDATAPADLGSISLLVVSGTGQSGVVGTELPQPLVIKATNRAGAPLHGITVNFHVTSGGGSMFAGSGSTDGRGIVSDYWTLGTSTAQTQRVEVRAVLANGQKQVFGVFTATALPGPAARIAAQAGDLQTATGGTAVPIAPAVRVSDQYGNPVPNLLVTFSVAAGGGSVLGATAITDVSGIAAVGRWTLGLIAGTNTLTATAAGSGITGNPVTFTATAVEVFTGVSTGTGYTCGVTIRGAAYCWGTNGSGQLGDGTGNSRPTPGAVMGGLTFAAVSAGFDHTCGVTTGGAAYCWGNAGSGQLGDGTGNNHASPVAVVGGLTFAAVSAGFDHTCGVTTGGAAYCWGDNTAGQLGDGSGLRQYRPVAVSGGLTFVTLSAGGGSTCGVTTGGAAYCWGANGVGTLGDGTMTNRPTPVAVVGGLTFAAVSAGVSLTCGVTTGGAAYCWGFNGEGQLGDGTIIERRSPVAVVGGLTFAAVSAGRDHSCGITTGGAAYCWGDDSFGELGDGTTTLRPSPVAVVGGLTFAALSASAQAHTCGVTTSGAAYCWGFNNVGQLGDGTTTNRTSPVAVVNP